MEEPLERLQQQIQFLVEIDKLKHIIRRSPLIGEKRLENSAEHSWHVTMLAFVLLEHSNEALDLLRVIKMLLIHDIVEIDAGDTFLYDPTANQDKLEREEEAAQRIFGLLPEDQAQEMHRLWAEFEAKETPEAKFAAALDRLMPLLHSYNAQGRNWQQHGVKADQVYNHNRSIGNGSDTLWTYAQTIINEALAQGYLPTSNQTSEVLERDFDTIQPNAEGKCAE